MPTELKSSVFPSNELTEPATGGLAADVALVRDALSRIDAAARADRAALDQLRGALGAMARTIARAKAAYAIASDSADTTALLDELEHLVDTMTEVAGSGAPAAAATIEPASVPTVSAVVSRRGDAAADQDAAAAGDAIHDAQEAAVSELKAMVVAMNAAAAAQVAAAQVAEAQIAEAQVAEADAAVTPDTASAPDIPEQPEALAEPQVQAEPQVPAEPEPAVEPEAVAEPDRAAEPVAPAETASVAEAASVAAEAPPATTAPATAAAAAAPLPELGVIHEGELLASFARMEAVPIPPPDEGTAVIFPKPPAPQPGLVLPAPQDIWALTAPGPEAPAAAAVEPEAAAPAASDAAASGAETAAASEPAAAVALPDAEFDPDEFLFGPEAKPDPALFGAEPEADPAAFLLEPTPGAPMPVAIAPLPQPDFGSVAAAKQPLQPADAAELSPSPAAPSSAAPSRIYDPLHALKAMSESERLALFS